VVEGAGQQLVVVSGVNRSTFLDQFGLGSGGLVDDGETFAGGCFDRFEVVADGAGGEGGADGGAAVTADEAECEGIFAEGVQDLGDVDGLAGGAVEGGDGAVDGVEVELTKDHDALSGRGGAEAEDGVDQGGEAGLSGVERGGWSGRVG